MSTITARAQTATPVEKRLFRFLDDNQNEIVELRRELHRHPELAFLEIETSYKAARWLEDLGFEVQVGADVMVAPPAYLNLDDKFEAAAKDAVAAGRVAPEWPDKVKGGCTGVVARLSRSAYPRVSFRFDMDGLPLSESTDTSHTPAREGFASRREGCMHACGHDGHTAIGLGFAKWLADSASEWSGTVTLIFQPAEEGGTGAKYMVQAGVVDDVDYFFAAHLGCSLMTGEIACEASEIFCSRRMVARFTGRPGHAADNPHEGRNALLAAATASLSIHGIPRVPSCATRINVGKLVSGDAFNIVPYKAELHVELRAAAESGLAFLEEQASRILYGTGAMHEVSVEIESREGALGGTNSQQATCIIERAARRTRGVEIIRDAYPLGGGEDATYFMRALQDRGGVAGYFLTGSDLTSAHHTSEFDFDEKALLIGIAHFAIILDEVVKQGA